MQLLTWWAVFRNTFSDSNYSSYIIWDNKDIRIGNKPVFYKTYYHCGIIYLNNLLLSLDNVRSLEIFKSKGLNTNFLTWSALRLSVPKDKLSSFPSIEFDPIKFKYSNTEFNTYSARCRQQCNFNELSRPNGGRSMDNHSTGGSFTASCGSDDIVQGLQCNHSVPLGLHPHQLRYSKCCV